MTDATQLWPMDVVLHQASGQLELLFNDGLRGRLDAPTLRAACRCAECESARRAGRPPSGGTGTRLREVRPVSNLGLQLCFSDGHERGIYPWTYLHEMSQP